MIRKLVVALVSVVMLGCESSGVNSTLAPEYANKVSPVRSVGVTGENIQTQDAAVRAFIAAGYSVKQVDGPDALRNAAAAGVDCLAIVSPPDKTNAADGMFYFSMRAVDVKNQVVMWSTRCKSNANRFFIRFQESMDQGMAMMVKDFSRSFPPKLE